jgi:hypothetical protein
LAKAVHAYTPGNPSPQPRGDRNVEHRSAHGEPTNRPTEDGAQPSLPVGTYYRNAVSLESWIAAQHSGDAIKEVRNNWQYSELLVGLEALAE